jgi:hypothetical protein
MTSGGACLEVVPSELFVLGDSIPTDKRLSWAPTCAGTYQPQNCYVLADAMGMLIVDPGPASVRAGVLAGLDAVPSCAASPVVFLTRYQLDAIGNLGAIADRLFPSAIYSGGVMNPFDSFDQVSAAQGQDVAATLRRLLPGEPIVYGEHEFEVLAPLLRLLATYWGYDRRTRTLFTSDSFTHATLSDRFGAPMIDDPAADETTADDVRAHLLATFEWLEGANTSPIIASLERLFAERDVRVIAPDRGCVLKGRDVVDRHVSLMLDVLHQIGGRS